MTLSSLREELSEAVEQVELLTSQLDEARRRADPASINAELKQVHFTNVVCVCVCVCVCDDIIMQSQELDQLRGQVEGLEKELQSETRRREEAEVYVEEKDAELAGALARLGEYERVMQ